MGTDLLEGWDYIGDDELERLIYNDSNNLDILIEKSKEYIKSTKYFKQRKLGLIVQENLNLEHIPMHIRELHRANGLGRFEVSD